MLGKFWMAFFKDQFKANIYKTAFFNEAEKYIEPHTYLTNVVSWLHLTPLQNIQFILHIFTATRNSNYGHNAWFVNTLICLFIISSKIFDKSTPFSKIHSFIYSFILCLPFPILQIELFCVSISSLIQQNYTEYLIFAHTVLCPGDGKIDQIHVYSTDPPLGPLFS